MNHAEFLAKQQEIYAKSFRQKEHVVMEKGLESDPAITNRDGGFFIACRHGCDFASKIEKLSHSIGCLPHLRPILTYYRETAHTTLATYMVSPDFRVDPDQEAHRQIIDDLWWAVCYVLCDPETCLIPTPLPIEIDYSEYLFNQTTVIAKGLPNENFVKLAEEIARMAKFRKIDLKKP